MKTRFSKNQLFGFGLITLPFLFALALLAGRTTTDKLYNKEVVVKPG